MHLSSDDGDGRERVPERGEGALLAVVAERRAGPLQLVDERDQVLHGRGARSGRVALGGRESADARSGAGEVRPTAQPRPGVGRSWSCGLDWWAGLASARRELIWILERLLRGEETGRRRRAVLLGHRVG